MAPASIAAKALLDVVAAPVNTGSVDGSVPDGAEGTVDGPGPGPVVFR